MKLIGLVAASVVLGMVLGGCANAPDPGARELVASVRATEPPNRPSGAFGGPVMWIEAGGQSAWMQPGSTCWRQPTPDGGGVTGCADATAPSCVRRGTTAAPTPSFTVRPGEQVWVHVVGPTVELAELAYEPFDIAATAADVEPVPEGLDAWAFRAPDAGALLTTLVRGSGTDGGDASFAMCIRVSGAAPPDAQPVRVTSTRSLIRSRATAELRFRLDADRGGSIPVAAGSLRCAHVLRHAVSKHLVWRCSALLQRPGATAGTRVLGTVATWKRGIAEWASGRVLVLASNQAHLGSRRGVVSVRGYLMEETAGHFRLCAAGYVSMPPSCNRGGVRVVGLDAAAYRLDSYGARRFSREDVAVFGQLTRGVLTADP